MRALVSGRVGLGVLARGAFDGHCVSEGPARSLARMNGSTPSPRVVAGRQVIQVLRLGVPNPRHCGARLLGRAPSGADLGLALPPGGQ